MTKQSVERDANSKAWEKYGNYVEKLLAKAHLKMDHLNYPKATKENND